MRNTALQNKPKTSKKIIPFVTTFNPATPNLKKILIKHWHLIAGKQSHTNIQKSPNSCLSEGQISEKLSEQEFLHFNLTTKELYTVGVK